MKVASSSARSTTRRSNGTYVTPHYRTAPDGIRSNNISYRGYSSRGGGRR